MSLPISLAPGVRMTGKSKVIIGTEGKAIEDSLSPALRTVISNFKEYLFLPSCVPVLVTLAVVAANRLEGDPLWLLLLGPPSSGKTEVLNTLIDLPNMHAVSTLTESALLSATSRKDVVKDSTGGLLNKIGSFGIIVLKDFTSVLSMNRDERTRVLAALREIFDGSWNRLVGVDGGRTLAWNGKVGLLAGCTDSIEEHHHGINSMGERFIRYRLPDADAQTQARRSSESASISNLRAYTKEKIKEFFSSIDFTIEPKVRSGERKRIATLATFVARARSPVSRDSYRREIEFVPESEKPGRLTKSLESLFRGLRAIGVGHDEAMICVCEVAMDCIPKVRRQILERLLEHHGQAPVSTLIDGIQISESSVRRALEDLQAHGLVSSVARPTGVGDQNDVASPKKTGGGPWVLTDFAVRAIEGWQV